MSMGENKAPGLERGYDRGSGKALGRLCEWVYPDGNECRVEVEYTEGDEYIEGWVEFESRVGLWVCSGHRDLMRRIRQLRGNGMVRQMVGLSESGKQVWDRNHFYALGRMRGQEERR